MKPMPVASAAPLGIPLSGKPYLGAPSVVEGLIQGLFSDVIALREQRLKNDQIDLRGALTRLGIAFQDVFYGHNPQFEPFHWNQPSQLGRSIVKKAGLEGDETDAVLRLSAKMIDEFVPQYLAKEGGQLSQAEFDANIEILSKRYTNILLGL